MVQHGFAARGTPNDIDPVQATEIEINDSFCLLREAQRKSRVNPLIEPEVGLVASLRFRDQAQERFIQRHVERSRVWSVKQYTPVPGLC